MSYSGRLAQTFRLVGRRSSSSIYATSIETAATTVGKRPYQKATCKTTDSFLSCPGKEGYWHCSGVSLQELLFGALFRDGEKPIWTVWAVEAKYSSS